MSATLGFSENMATCQSCATDVGPVAETCANCGASLQCGSNAPLTSETTAKQPGQTTRKIPFIEGLIVAAVLGILTNVTLDTGWSARIFSYAVVPYVAGLGLISSGLFRSRKRSPDLVDVMFVRWGSVIMFFVVIALNKALGGG